MRKALLVYLAAAAVYTWPLALHPTTRLAAPVGPGDPYLYLWVFGWVMGTLVRAPLDVLNGRVFNANIFHPAESTLAYSDHMILQSAAMTPIYALTGDVVLCYNVLLFGSLALSGLAMHAFVRNVTGSTGGAYLAGLTWAFFPYRFAHLVHIQLQALYFLPLAFLLLHRLMAGRRTRDALGLGVVLALQALSSAYYGVIGAAGIAVAAIALAVVIGRWRSGQIARQLVLAAVVGAVLVAPVAWVYLRVQRAEGFGRTLYEASRNAAHIRSYAQVPAENVAYGRTGLLPVGLLEQALFPGLVVLGLAVVGAVRGRRGDARPLVMAMLSVAAIGFVLSLGPDGFRDLYAFFHRRALGFAAIRAPARFAVLVTFALATLAALGWRELAGSRNVKTRRLAFGLIAVAAFEVLHVPLPLAAAPPRRTDAGQWLRHEPGPGAVVHLPIGPDSASSPAMVQSLEHRRPIVNGYSGQRPAFYNALVDTLATFPSGEAMLTLNDLGVRFVVTPGPVAPPSLDVPWPLVERARFPDGAIYELRWTPEIEARLASDPAILPPPPGPVPFGAGETARYRAFWAGAGMDVAAGAITVSVQSGGQDRSTFTLVARGETAPWMARFYEVHDTFTTRTGPGLLPLEHARDQARGSDRATRTFLYQHPDRVIRIGRDARHASGEEGVSLPLAESARDILSAVFYARTLPLIDGDRYLIPVNEGGRNLVVELAVAGRESITVQGRQVPSIRLDPRVRRRFERRRPVSATLWLSDDGPRVPLALDLDAAFGRVRLELISYQPGGPAHSAR
ncbi:MAG: DUF3108 domain-containing protein [Vicinamibacterales bacterium]